MAAANIHIMSSPLMMNPRKTWLSNATKDPAYFHAGLSHYTAHFTQLHEQGDPTEALVYRMEAVRPVNERLGAAELGISDGTVGAVACIFNHEVSRIGLLP